MDEAYFQLGLILLVIGLLGIAFRRDLILILISFDLLSNGLYLIGSSGIGNLKGSSFGLLFQFALACDSILGVVLVSLLFRKYRNKKTDFYRTLRG